MRADVELVAAGGSVQTRVILKSCNSGKGHVRGAKRVSISIYFPIYKLKIKSQNFYTRPDFCSYFHKKLKTKSTKLFYSQFDFLFQIFLTSDDLTR